MKAPRNHTTLLTDCGWPLGGGRIWIVDDCHTRWKCPSRNHSRPGSVWDHSMVQQQKPSLLLSHTRHISAWLHSSAWQLWRLSTGAEEEGRYGELILDLIHRFPFPTWKFSLKNAGFPLFCCWKLYITAYLSQLLKRISCILTDVNWSNFFCRTLETCPLPVLCTRAQQGLRSAVALTIQCVFFLSTKRAGYKEH